MRNLKYFWIAMLLAIFTPVRAQPVLTGSVALACSAILCLSTSTSYAACGPALSYYFGIQHRYLNDTINARYNFLNTCPAASTNENMNSLVKAISHGGGRCDVETLNRNTFTTKNESVYIDDRIPSHCKEYWNHSYTIFDKIAVYVGVPERKGFWVKPDRYAEELAKYQVRIDHEDRINSSQRWGGN